MGKLNFTEWFQIVSAIEAAQRINEAKGLSV